MPENETTDPLLVAANIRKADAEADAALAQARLHDANAAKALHEAEGHRHNAAMMALSIADAERASAAAAAADVRHHVYTIDTEISEASVGKAIRVITEWMRVDEATRGDNDLPCQIEIRLCSPGGSLIDGMYLWDFLARVKARGHRLRTVAYGYAASMAGILLQAGDERVIGAESWLMIHEVAFGMSGKTSVIEDRTEWVKKVQDRVAKIFYDKSRNAPKPMTLAAIKKGFERKDWWLDSAEALERGFVDVVE